MANLENRGLVTPGDGAGIGEEPELKGVLMAIETSPLATGPSDRPPGRNAPRRWPWLLGLLILALVTAAIAFVVTEPSGDKTVEAGSAAATISDDVLVNAYVAAFLASDAIATNPKVSPNDPSLDAVISEPLLGFVRSQLAGFRSQGLVYEPGGLAHSNTHVVEKGSDRAVLRSCLVEKGYATVNGERRPAPGPPGTRTAMEAIAVRDAASGVWKISSRYPNSGGRECNGA